MIVLLVEPEETIDRFQTSALVLFLKGLLQARHLS